MLGISTRVAHAGAALDGRPSRRRRRPSAAPTSGDTKLVTSISLQARGLQAVHELDLVRGRHRLRFVLQAVARADVDQGDVGGQGHRELLLGWRSAATLTRGLAPPSRGWSLPRARRRLVRHPQDRLMDPRTVARQPHRPAPAPPAGPGHRPGARAAGRAVTCATCCWSARRWSAPTCRAWRGSSASPASAWRTKRAALGRTRGHRRIWAANTSGFGVSQPPQAPGRKGREVNPPWFSPSRWFGS